LTIAVVGLIGLRIAANIADSGVIDVGYASVVGADRIADGEPLYGSFPSDVASGDTYGPANYLAYLPFEAIWPWGGGWDDLPAAHAAAVVFDLATFALLYLLGLRLRDRKLAATLAFAWAAYPYTAYALESNSNDTLVALLLTATLLAFARPLARGALLALAALTKFAPLVLAPMLLGGGLAVGAFAGVTTALLSGPPSTPALPPSGTARSPTRPAATRRSASGARWAGWSRSASRSSRPSAPLRSSSPSAPARRRSPRSPPSAPRS
jgi:hypothetical protein